MNDCSHVYLSTACHHGRHAECRRSCKFCPAKCGCFCGHPAVEHSEWELFIPLMEVKPRYNRRLKKMVNQSPWLTLNDRDSWFRRKRLTEYYRVMGRTAAELADLPKDMEHAHVEYWVSYGSRRRLDPHNYMLTAKAVIDGLIDYGMLPDDDSKHLTGPDPRRDESLPVGLTVRVFRVGGGFDAVQQL